MKTTKVYKVENFDAVKAESDIYMLALGDVLNGDVIWSMWIPDTDGGAYRIGHAGPDRAAGGAMLVLYRYKGQRNSAGCFGWDDMSRTVRESHTEWGSLIREGIADISRKRIAA